MQDTQILDNQQINYKLSSKFGSSFLIEKNVLNMFKIDELVRSSYFGSHDTIKLCLKKRLSLLGTSITRVFEINFSCFRLEQIIKLGPEIQLQTMHQIIIQKLIPMTT